MTKSMILIGNQQCNTHKENRHWIVISELNSIENYQRINKTHTFFSIKSIVHPNQVHPYRSSRINNAN